MLSLKLVIENRICSHRHRVYVSFASEGQFKLASDFIISRPS
jgi:hypothetical protein